MTTKAEYALEFLVEKRRILRDVFLSDGESLLSIVETMPILFKDDKEVMTKAIRKNAGVFLHATQRLKDDTDVVTALLTSHEAKLERKIVDTISSNFTNNKYFMLDVIKKNAFAFFAASKRLLDDEKFTKDLESPPWRHKACDFSKLPVEALGHISYRIRSNAEKMFGFMRHFADNEEAIEYVPVTLMDDKEFVLRIQGYRRMVKIDDSQFISKRLRSDAQFMETWYQNRAENLISVRDTSPIWDDRDFAIAIFENWARPCYCLLGFFSKRLQDDEEVGKKAIKYAPASLEYMSDRLKDDKEIVALSIKDSPASLEHASDRLKDDKEIVALSITRDGRAITHASDRLRGDYECAIAAVANCPAAFGYITHALQSDRILALKAVEEYGMNLHFVGAALRSDREIVLAAVTNNGAVLELASQELRDDWEVVIAAVSSSDEAWASASARIRNDCSRVKSVFKIRPRKETANILANAGPIPKNDKSLILKAVNRDTWSIDCISESLKLDPDVTIAALRRHRLALATNSGLMRVHLDELFTILKNHGEFLFENIFECLQKYNEWERIKMPRLEFVAELWLSRMWHQIWLMMNVRLSNQHTVGSIDGIARNIVEFWGIKVNIKLFPEMSRLEKLLNVMIKKEVYPGSDYWEDYYEDE